MLTLPVALLADAASLFAAFWLAFWARFQIPFVPVVPAPPSETYQGVAVFVAMIGTLSLLASGAYQRAGPALRFLHGQTSAIVRSTLLTGLVVITATSLFREVLLPQDTLAVSRMIIVMFCVISAALLLGWRTALGWLLSLLRSNGWGSSRMLVIGLSPTSTRFCKALQDQPALGYVPVGILSLSGQSTDDSGDEAACGLPVWCGRDRLEGILRSAAVAEAVCVFPHPAATDLLHIVDVCKKTDVRLSFVPDVADVLLAPTHVWEVAGFPLFVTRQEVLRGWNRQTKRLVDLVLSAFLLVLLAPLLIPVCLAIKVSSRGSVLFRQERVGRGSVPFFIYKLRSMTTAPVGDPQPPAGNSIGATPAGDPRVTTIGRFIRRFSIDELPQLLNVLKGEMSLVGPRPHIPAEVAEYEDWQRRKLEVLPGITGLTQVSGRKDLSLEDMIRLDIYYIENWSVWFDLQILLRTIPVVLNGRGAY